VKVKVEKVQWTWTKQSIHRFIVYLEVGGIDGWVIGRWGWFWGLWAVGVNWGSVIGRWGWFGGFIHLHFARPRTGSMASYKYNRTAMNHLKYWNIYYTVYWRSTLHTVLDHTHYWLSWFNNISGSFNYLVNSHLINW